MSVESGDIENVRVYAYSFFGQKCLGQGGRGLKRLDVRLLY